MKAAIFIASAAMLLAGCGERAQTSTGIKSDAQPFSGTNRPFVATGWKQGDKTSWEQQLKTRTWNGQNDYTRVN